MKNKYELKNVTSEDMICCSGSCPGIYQTSNSYLIIGKKINPVEAGLESKVGKHEVLIEVPKKLIDKKEN